MLLSTFYFCFPAKRISSSSSSWWLRRTERMTLGRRGRSRVRVPLVESPCPLGTASLSTVSSPARHSQTSPQSRKRTQGTETTAVATGMVSPTELSSIAIFGMRRASLASQKDPYTVLALPQEWAYLDDLWGGRIMITPKSLSCLICNPESSWFYA